MNEHDKANRCATGRRIKLDPETNRIRVIEEVDAVTEPVAIPAPIVSTLFETVPDARLRALAFQKKSLLRSRNLLTIEMLEGAEDRFDPLTYQILYAVAAGYGDERSRHLPGSAESRTRRRIPPQRILTSASWWRRSKPPDHLHPDSEESSVGSLRVSRGVARFLHPSSARSPTGLTTAVLPGRRRPGKTSLRCTGKASGGQD